MSISKKQFTRGIILRADDVGVESVEGELKVSLTSKLLQVYLDGALRTVITGSQVQTLSNKTLTSPVLNTGVSGSAIDTDVTLAANSDTLLASQKAVKAYVDASTASKDAASEISFVPVGNIAATNVQTMGQELDADLSTEIARATAAEALVQSNLNTEASTRSSADTTLQTNIDNHVNDIAGAHAASAIANTPAGNLAATDMQGAVNELQTDVDTRATSAALTAHESATAVHGATGAVVGTTNVQTLTNKTLTAPVINAPTGIVKADVGLGNVDNTSDLAKPISTATQTALDAKAAGAASSVDNHLARFDGITGKIIQDGSTAVLSDAGVMSGLTGISSSGTANFSGTLASTGTLAVTGVSQEGTVIDGSTTGANALIPGASLVSPIVRLTNASLTSIGGINASQSGQSITIINDTGADVQLINQYDSSGFEINTGTGGDVTFKEGSAMLFKYNSGLAHWNVIGGTGSGAGGSASLDTIFQLTGTELLATWSTGDNATFLGGGTLSGTFDYNTVTPLSGEQSYRYTQAAGSLNDYLASPAQDVDLRFRGQDVTLFFPYKYDGATNDIEVVFYDVTNAAIIPSSVFLENAPTVSIFKTNIIIPTTCTSIRVGFQTDVLNSGKILEFADVQLTSDTTVYADISNDTATVAFTATGSWTTNSTYSGFHWRTGEYLNVRGQIALAGAPTATGLTINIPSGLTIDTAKLTATLSAGDTPSLGTANYLDAATAIYPGIVVYNNSTSVFLKYLIASTSNATQGTVTQAAPFSWGSGDSAYYEYRVPIVGWTATSTNILTVPETFSSDTAAFTYAGSATYTLATLANAPVGTYITYTYAASTNTQTQTTTRPTQTDADMNTNGILIYARAYNAASTAGNPACIAIQIGKGLKGVNRSLYKSAGKAISGELNYYMHGNDANAKGFWANSYNENTGILYLDAGTQTSVAVTSATFNFSSGLQASGYLVINASKNPALTGMNLNRVAARGVSTSGQSIATTATTLTYDSEKTFDTHGALNAATGVFTAPETGYYSFSTKLSFVSDTYTSGQAVTVYAFKNGTQFTYNQWRSPAAAAVIALLSLVDTVHLAKGDTFYISAINAAGPTALDTFGANSFAITKIGS